MSRGGDDIPRRDVVREAILRFIHIILLQLNWKRKTYSKEKDKEGEREREREKGKNESQGA